MSPVPMAPDDARRLLDEHFGATNVPEKLENLLAWWKRVRSDPSTPPRMRLACERDLEDVLGPIVGGGVEWVMTS